MKRRFLDDDGFFCDGRDCDSCILNDADETEKYDGDDESGDESESVGEGCDDDDSKHVDGLVDRLVELKDRWMDTDFKPCHGPFIMNP